ncbi:TolC family protein [Spongiivirga citrea]|uniref:TolC family protein n=1 Tax=Spongiivirga citrea TaxID=1481457 RepID=A0A6M0CDG6_9FLAO|nr:TolC family protein [Spongiivirga citrea]NER15781.1 TolC family protein [Spongiivirga citrea]
MRNFLLFLITVLCIVSVQAQTKKITLEDAIKVAQKESPDYVAAVNRFQSGYWGYRRYQAGFLPGLRLDATLPNYSESVTRIQNDLGQDIFVNQNQAITDLNLSLRQNVPFTGGVFSVQSRLDRVDIFGENETTRYNIIPFSLNYFQNSLFYNPFKWDKKIEPLLYEESKRDFVEKMEDISLRTCRRYFGLLRSQIQLKIAETNLANQDTLYKIAQNRFKIGKIAENELLQLELSLLNARNNKTNSEINLKQTSQNLARFLRLESEDVELSVPEELALFDVSTQKALEEAQNNRKAVIEFRRRRLQAEKEVARVKGTNRLQINLNANFGISQNGNDFDQLFGNYLRQQSVSLRLGVPIFDWGVSKAERKVAEADLELTNTNIEQDQEAFEQEIYLHTLNWSNQRQFLATAEKAQEVAAKRYDISKARFILGKITITDLNLAQQEKDIAIVDYLESLEKFWVDYYTLRRLTLYDFIEKDKIRAEDLVFD